MKRATPAFVREVRNGLRAAAALTRLDDWRDAVWKCTAQHGRYQAPNEGADYWYFNGISDDDLLRRATASGEADKAGEP